MSEESSAVLFHGTSRDSADAIERQGFAAVDVDHHASAIADRFGISSEGLLPPTSFPLLRRSDDRVYTTPSLMKAAQYAHRSGELERMLLEQAYDLLFGEPDSAVDPARIRWVREQRRPQPAVVALQVPKAELGNSALIQIANHKQTYEHADPLAYSPDIELPLALANSVNLSVFDVDFCVCTPPPWERTKCGRQFCIVCASLRASLGLPAVDEIDDWDPFECGGPWMRLNGSPAVGPGGVGLDRWPADWVSANGGREHRPT